MALRLLKATPEASLLMAKHARKADRKEWFMASGGLKLDVAIELCRRGSLTVPRMVMDEFGTVLTMWGCGVSGMAWMVCSELALERVHDLHRFFKEGIAEMHELWPTLTAWSYGENSVHHKWMWRFGFRPSDILKVGGEEFLCFKRHKEDH
jgi:hypothetical protein